MFQLKPISKEGIPVALDKAERYRLLNEPRLAESICLDVLETEPENARAVTTMLLAITEQFGHASAADVSQARQLLPRLKEYEQHYFGGIINERKGLSILNRGITGSQFAAYEWLTEAMECYEKAEAIRPPGNDDAILRWNTCVRMITSHDLKPREREPVELGLE